MASSDYAREIFFVDGARTPFLRDTGRQGPFSASDLAVAAGKALISRLPIKASDIDEVIIGSAMPGPDEANIGRITALRLNCGHKTTGWTVMRNCASAMQALDSAAKDIAIGRADLVLAGGTEAMSRAPLIYNDDAVAWFRASAKARKPGDKIKTFGKIPVGAFLKPVIALLRGLRDSTVDLDMGQTCEIISHRFGIDRKAMDAYAVESHLRLAAAFDQGLMDEVVPLYSPDGTVFEEDTGLRRDSSAEKLAKLRPVFDRNGGIVTAGNSSQITDGAALMLMASRDAVERYNLPVLGRLVDTEWSGLDPAQMGLGPAYAAAPLLTRQHLALDDVDIFEINEAFAGQVLSCLAAWEDDDFCRGELDLAGALGRVDMDKLNVDGGAISIGHPVGASGARIVLHALNALKRNNGRRAIATLCIGGGQGGAMLLERE
jgi:acetyl-CoA C-acetyltransferase